MIITALVWDEFNEAHIARHQVSRDEVEQVCSGEVLSAETYAGRLRVIGATTEGRMLTVIMAPKGETTYYVVTARSASRAERKVYLRWRGGEAA